MQRDMVTVTTGYVVDDEHGISLTQLCHTCSLTVDDVVELVDEGILQVHGGSQVHWRFSSENLRRARVAVRLKNDLEINLAGIAVTLDLLEQVEALRRRLGVLESRNVRT